jgi:tetratricopeptide (TPR) repeat protein
MKTLETEVELGRIYLASGQFDLAEDVLQGTLKIYERLWGRQDWRTISTVVMSLANLYTQTEEYTKAEPLRREIIQMSDSDSVTYAKECHIAMWSLAIRCTVTDRYKEAEVFADQAIEIFTKFLKRDIP